MNLKNKKVLITGATGGIGNNLVETFDNLGATVVATGTNEEKLNNLKKRYPKIYTEPFKLQDHKKIESFIERVDEKLNGLEILINNAGITLDNLSLRLTEDNWKKVIDINLNSTFLMCKYSIKKMLKKKYGKSIFPRWYDPIHQCRAYRNWYENYRHIKQYCVWIVCLREGFR